MPKIITPSSYYKEVSHAAEQWVNTSLGFDPTYEEAQQPSIDQWGLPWFRAGVLVINSDGKILLVHEARVQVGKIKNVELRQRMLTDGFQPNSWVDGDGGWNLPAGRLQVGEQFEAGAMREAREESGCTIVIQQFLFARHSEKPGNLYFMPVYLASPITEGAPDYATAETSEVAWLSPAEIRELHNNGQLRSPEFVLDSLKAYEALQVRRLSPEAAESIQQSSWSALHAGVLAVDEWPLSSAAFEDGSAPTFLLVKEAQIEEHQPDGSIKWVPSDQGKWRLPCDRLYPGEAFAEAASRAVLEQSGEQFRLEKLCHIGRCCDHDGSHVIMIYSAQVPGAKPIKNPDPTEIADVSWFSYDDICELRSSNQLRNPELIMGAVEQYCQYKPVATVATYTYLFNHV